MLYNLLEIFHGLIWLNFFRIGCSVTWSGCSSSFNRLENFKGFFTDCCLFLLWNQVAIWTDGVDGKNIETCLVVVSLMFSATNQWLNLLIWEVSNKFYFVDEWRIWDICLPWRGQHILLERNNQRQQRYSFWRNRIQAIPFIPKWLSFQASKSQVWNQLLPSQCGYLWQHLLGHSSGKIKSSLVLSMLLKFCCLNVLLFN